MINILISKKKRLSQKYSIYGFIFGIIIHLFIPIIICSIVDVLVGVPNRATRYIIFPSVFISPLLGGYIGYRYGLSKDYMNKKKLLSLLSDEIPDVNQIGSLINKYQYLVYIIDEIERTPLHIVAKNGSENVARLLFQYLEKKDINRRDAEGKTPLDLAIAEGQNNIAELLRQHSAVE